MIFPTCSLQYCFFEISRWTFFYGIIMCQRQLILINEQHSHIFMNNKTTAALTLYNIIHVYNISVDGDWSPWSGWTQCSTTCGIGSRDRKRTCTNPPPQNKGAPCAGNGTQTHSCFDRKCPGTIRLAKLHAHRALPSPAECFNHKTVSSCLLLGPPGSNWCFSFAPKLVSYSAPRDLHRRAAYSICFIRMFIVIYLFVLDNSLTS